MSDRIPTLKDVALAAGVSKSAVSRALLGQGDVSAANVARVRAAARALGYIPNGAARSLVASRSGVVGAHVRDVSKAFYGELLASMQANAIGRDLRVVATSGLWDLDLDQESRLLETLITLRVDSIVVSSSTLPTDFLAGFLPRVPIVLCGWPEVDDRFPAVFIDELQGARQIAELLLAQGHRRVATLEVSESVSRSQAHRGAIIHSTLAARGTRVLRLSGPTMLHDATEAAVSREVTAIACPTNDMAMELILALRSRAVAVPDEVSVTGFDATGPLGSDAFGITSFRPPVDELGNRALQLATSLNAGGEHDVPRILLAGDLVIGSTSAAVGS